MGPVEIAWLVIDYIYLAREKSLHDQSVAWKQLSTLS